MNVGIQVALHKGTLHRAIITVTPFVQESDSSTNIEADLGVLVALLY